MARIWEGSNEYQFIDNEGLIVTIHADSYDEACEKYKEFCGQ